MAIKPIAATDASVVREQSGDLTWRAGRDSQSDEHTAGAGTHLDLFAAGVCALCLVHCFALPLTAALLPVAALSFNNPLVHQSLVLLAAPATLWLACKALPVERSWSFRLPALVGLGLLLLGAFIEAVSAYEEPITVVGAVLLSYAHLRRWVRHRRCAVETAGECLKRVESRKKPPLSG